MRLSDRPPWIIRTYAGFGDADESNARFRQNLQKGQRGLSIAFDLPTQNGYDSDHPMAQGEVGGTGVAVCHLGDLRRLLDGIPLGDINTSMTINATAPWLLALYLSLATEQGVPWTTLRGTTQNDLMKEFVARGTHIFDPATSLRLSTDLITFAAEHVPLWNPTNACGYHYMESGATPAEEVGFALANAVLLLDAVRPKVSPEAFRTVVERISFFINSGLELVAEIAKVRAYARLWPRLCRELYGLEGAVFRAGCQVRSLTLTAEQPEVNIVRIAYQALPVVLSASARVGALQLPGFREALALPDEAEQTLALRTQQVLMYETDLAAHGDLFEGSVIIEAKTAAVEAEALALVQSLRAAGYVNAIPVIAERLTRGLCAWRAKVESGEQVVVGKNAFLEPVGLVGASAGPVRDTTAGLTRHVNRLRTIRRQRDDGVVAESLVALRAAFDAGHNVMPATLQLAAAGGTTGEWTRCIEGATNGRYSAPLGIDAGAPSALIVPRATTPVRLVLGKVGLDGHINAVKLLAVACQQAGMEVVYTGLKQTPEALVATAEQEDADVIGISSLSGAHLYIAAEVRRLLTERAMTEVPVVMGGIIPASDHDALRQLGIAAIFTPESGALGDAVAQILALAQR